MTGFGGIFEFPTGRRIEAPRQHSADTVARLVRCLAGRNLPASPSEAAEPLPIALDALVGVADETVGGLAGLVGRGIITPASAARLALRHASECARTRTGHPLRSDRRDERHSQLTTTLVGDVFAEFALRLHRGGCWLGIAAWPSITYLYELCPPDRHSVCLLVGCDAERRNVVRVLAPTDWRARLANIRSYGKGVGVQQVVLIGGLPRTQAGRRSVLVDLHRGLTRAGTIAIEGPSTNSSLRTRNARCTSSGFDVLTMIEIVMPGLVDLDPATSRYLP